MTPDQLRALADALSRQRQADEHGIYCAVPRQAVDAAIKYLRAQADAQPVAWMRPDNRVREESFTGTQFSRGEQRPPIGTWNPLYTHPAPAAPHHAMLDSHRRLVEQAIQSAEHPSGMSTHDGKARIDASILRRMLAIIDSLSAAPQAEPCIGNDSACPCQDGDACHYKDSADGTKAWPVPQSEPKRDWSVIDAAIREYLDGYEQIGEDDAGADACYTPTERERDLIYDAINGLLADESFVAAISAPQAEPKREPTCLWSRADDDDTDVWETSCGHAFTIIEGTPSDNHMEFCCYCGRRVDEEIGGSDE